MDFDERLEYLKLPPEQVRIGLVYPDLPNPIPFATAETDGIIDTQEGIRHFSVSFEIAPGEWGYDFDVTEQHYRIIGEYEAARERQQEAAEACALARWNRPAPRAPVPDEIPPGGKLTPRQETFCRHYATQPVATRAAVLAGYSEENAAPYGSRLLKNALVLDRIAKLREEQHLEYVVHRDTVQDKIEAVFFDALEERSHAAAVAALRLQATLAGIMPNGAGRAKAIREKANKSQGPGLKKSQEKPRWKANRSQGQGAPNAKKSQAKPTKAKGLKIPRR